MAWTGILAFAVCLAGAVTYGVAYIITFRDGEEYRVIASSQNFMQPLIWLFAFLRMYLTGEDKMKTLIQIGAAVVLLGLASSLIFWAIEKPRAEENAKGFAVETLKVFGVTLLWVFLMYALIVAFGG